MDRQPYLGFEFDKTHTSDFNLWVVSDGSRYHLPLYNSFSDSLVQVPGRAGDFWFGTEIANREITVHLAFDNLLTKDIPALQRWLYPNKAQWLIFDETPYKRYFAKIAGTPTMSFVPFEAITKGECDVTFSLLGEYGEANPNWEFNEDLTEESGIIPPNYIRKNILMPGEKKNIEAAQPVYIYNAGNGVADAEFHFICSPFPVTAPLKITNAESGTTSILRDIRKLLPATSIYWEISIQSARKECWAWGLNDQKKRLHTDPVHIGAAFNHFYPRIYHIKPVKTRHVGQVVHGTDPDLLVYSYPISSNDDFQPSNMPKADEHVEAFDDSFSDYILCTPQDSYFIDSVLSPMQIQIKQVDGQVVIPPGTKGYFIRPNRFFFNKDLEDFSAMYKHTYI